MTQEQELKFFVSFLWLKIKLRNANVFLHESIYLFIYFLPFAIKHSEEFLSRINFDEEASFFTLFPSTISCNSLLEGRLVFYCKVIVKYWFGCYLNLNVFYWKIIFWIKLQCNVLFYILMNSYCFLLSDQPENPQVAILCCPANSH